MGLAEGIDWISPMAGGVSPEHIEAVKEIGGSPPFMGIDSDLALHLLNAIVPLADKLTERNHVQTQTREPFRCLSYFSEDEYGSASCRGSSDQYLAGMGIGFLRKLIKAACLMEPALALRPRTQTPGERHSETKLEPSPDLARLLEGSLEISQEEVEASIQDWPHPVTFGENLGMGTYAVFYDLIRLIWVHEWAHAFCGHVDFSREALKLHVFDEFSEERAGRQNSEEVRFPRNEILQAFEIHADGFAVETCLIEIFWGDDPVGRMAGPNVDLVDRLLVFNVACAIFAVTWSLTDYQNAPEESYFASSQPGASQDPHRIFRVIDATHPPAYLRYSAFRDLQRDVTMRYGAEHGRPDFGPMVDAFSFSFLDRMSQLCGYFEDLKVITPVIAKTPTMKVVYAYTDYLHEVSASLAPYLQQYGFVPTDTFATQE